MFYHDTGSENGNDVFPNITQRCERQQSSRGVMATMVTGGNIDIYYNQNIITLSTAQYNLVIMTLFINTPPLLYIWTQGGRFRMYPRKCPARDCRWLVETATINKCENSGWGWWEQRRNKIGQWRHHVLLLVDTAHPLTISSNTLLLGPDNVHSKCSRFPPRTLTSLHEQDL